MISLVFSAKPISKVAARRERRLLCSVGEFRSQQHRTLRRSCCYSRGLAKVMISPLAIGQNRNVGVRGDFFLRRGPLLQNGSFGRRARPGEVRRAIRGARVDEHIRAGYHADAGAREAPRRRTRPADARSFWASFSPPQRCERLLRRPPARPFSHGSRV